MLQTIKFLLSSVLQLITLEFILRFLLLFFPSLDVRSGNGQQPNPEHFGVKLMVTENSNLKLKWQVLTLKK